MLENSLLIYGILKSRKRFQAIRAFTLESGQQEIERQDQFRKSNPSASDGVISPLSQSVEDLQITSVSRSSLGHIPEESGPFAIGGDDSDDDEEGQNTPSQSSPSARDSRTPSVSSSVEDSVPLQLQGMSEKARGKMPAGQMSFSRQNSVTSLSSHTVMTPSTSASFTPTAAWVSHYFEILESPFSDHLLRSNRGCLTCLFTQLLRSSRRFLPMFRTLPCNHLRARKHAP